MAKRRDFKAAIEAEMRELEAMARDCQAQLEVCRRILERAEREAEDDAESGPHDSLVELARQRVTEAAE